MFSDALPEPQLKVSVGQHSDRGRKSVNQDFYGFRVPPEPQLSAKGIAIAVADGIGSSDVSQVAAEFAVMAFLDDYYSTSETWSVKKSADRVLAAANSWLMTALMAKPIGPPGSFDRSGCLSHSSNWFS